MRLPWRTWAGLTSVDDAILYQVLPACGGFVFVDPLRLEPVVVRYEAERHWSGDDGAHFPV